MSIEAHLWDREAFTLSDKDQAWSVKRRAFPPRLDSAQDRTNIEEKTHYFSSLILLFERRNPMQFCAGVNGFFVHQNVTAILLTDSIFAKGLAFKNIVASFAWMHCSSGRELVARSAYLYDGKIEKVACAEGIFVKMEIDLLITAAAVVLHDCTVRQIVINPQLQSGPVRSLTTFEDKFLCHDIVFNAPPTSCPKIILAGTSQTPMIDFQPILLGQHSHKNSLQIHEEIILPCFEKWMRDNRACPINFYMDRGAFWGFDLFDPSRAHTTLQTCLICQNPLSAQEKVVGHFAPTAANQHVLHCYCATCFKLLRENSSNASSALQCSYCRAPFKKMALPIRGRVESSLEMLCRNAMKQDLQFACANEKN